MINTDYFKNKRALVVGMARSGVACANLLFDLGTRVRVTDNQDSLAVRLNLEKLKSKDISVELGKHTPEFIRNNDFIVISPGVDDSALPVVLAKQFGIPIISEIEVAWMLCPAQIIAVTGSCGKTTVTTLIGRVLDSSGRRVITCGNIGNPFCGEVDKLKPGDFVSLEVSSFQLEAVSKFRPKISVMLNFSRNHLDRYKGMQEYLNAKKRIFLNQDCSDFLVLNANDATFKELAKETRAKVAYFYEDKEFNPNQSAVVAVAGVLGINKEVCQKVFNDFKGIEHRMESAANIKGIEFINDSKATTVESAIWAISNISKPIVLIAGGKDKGVDYGLILEYCRNKVKDVVLIGQAREKIKKALNGALPVEEAVSLEDAVNKAFLKAKPGDCVLLSPMCSSFDMFSSYEERGRVFKKIVNGLAGNKTLNSKP